MTIAGCFSLLEIIIPTVTSCRQRGKTRSVARNCCGTAFGRNSRRSESYKIGVESSKMNLLLQISAQTRSMPISWTYQDVRHRFGATSKESLLDGKSLAAWIRVCRDDPAISGCANRLSGCFFEFFEFGCFFASDFKL